MIKFYCQSPFEILNNCYKYTQKVKWKKNQVKSDLVINKD